MRWEPVGDRFSPLPPRGEVERTDGADDREDARVSLDTALSSQHRHVRPLLDGRKWTRTGQRGDLGLR